MSLFKRASRNRGEIEAIEAELSRTENGDGAAPQEPAREEPAPSPPESAGEPVESIPPPSAESPPPAPAPESTPPPAAESTPPVVEAEPSPAVESTPSPAAKSTPPPRPPENGAGQIDVRRAAPAETDDEAPRLSAAEAIAPTRVHAAGPDGEPETATAKVYAFANQKGGVAKTTTTLNLAVAFRETGHRVLAIDLDPQGNLTMSQGIDPDKAERSMYDVLINRVPIRDVIQSREIDIAVASIDLAGAEIAMSTMIGRERSLEKALAEVSGDYDFICIDTPPSLGLLTVNALTAADKVIVPVQCEYLSMRGLVQLQNTLEMIRDNLNPRVEIEGILPTMLDARTVHAKEAIEILEENFGELVFKSRIRKAIKFAEAPVRGSSVLKYDPNGNAAEYYRELAKEVLTHGAS
jgi:chromosome partitioning protein